MVYNQSKGLIKDELILLEGKEKRAAACFPIFNLEFTDTKLVFQNYWKWKRGIDVFYNITIRKTGGNILYEVNLIKPQDQNIFSCKKIFEDLDIDFKEATYGTIEIEIFSKENIVFPFPAVLAYYESINGFISVVHSAGRTLNKPSKEYEDFRETNFYVSSKHSYKPFIHLFNGPYGIIKDLKIQIKSNYKNKFSLDFDIEKELNIYCSDVIFLDDFINIYKQKLMNCDQSITNENLENIELIIILSGKSKSIFPRFVCGNFDVINNHPFVTHSFREIINNFDTIEVTNNKLSSTIALSIIEGIDVRALIFPTTSPSSNNLNICFYDLDSNKIIKEFHGIDISNNGESFNIDKSKYGNSTRNIGLTVSPSKKEYNCKIPSRIPVSIRYGLSRGMKSLHTDIALQFRTSLAKRKTNYWYQGFLKKDITNILFISQFIPGVIQSEYQSKQDLEFIFYLKISEKEWKSRKFMFKRNELSIKLDIQEISKSLYLNELFKDYYLYSWRIELKEGSIQDIYCVSFDEKIGLTFGEHSF